MEEVPAGAKNSFYAFSKRYKQMPPRLITSTKDSRPTATVVERDMGNRGRQDLAEREFI